MDKNLKSSQTDSAVMQKSTKTLTRAHTTPFELHASTSTLLARDMRTVKNRDDDEGIDEDTAQTIIDIGVSRAQTHFESSTPVAVKSAELDSRNGWEFLDNMVDDEQEKMICDGLRETFIPASDLDTPAEEKTSRTINSKLQDVSRKEGNQTEVVEKASPKNRSRAGSAATLLGDLNIMRLIPGLSTLSKPAQRSPRPGSRDGAREPTTRPSRSNTIFGNKISWASSLTLRPRSRDSSPKNSPVHRRMMSSPILSENTSSQPSISTTEVFTKDTQLECLKRCASHDSISHSLLSKISSIEDDERFAHIDSQANTRVKALRDAITDNLPSMSTLNFSAFKTEFSFSKASTASLPRSISAVFSGSGNSQENAESLPVSPLRTTFTNPRYPFFEEAVDNLTGDLVVLGGYRGSTLRSAEPPHRQIWAPIKIGLNIRNVDLEVGLNPEDEENMESRIFPSGMLTHVGPIDISRRLLTRLRKCKNSKTGDLRVVDWGYDWRLSPALLTKKLISFLEGLQCNQPGALCPGATVIAHSLGGLIARKAVNDRPELFAGVVYVGTPQFCVNILGPLRNGDDVLLSTKILTAQVNFTLRTSFLLLPESGQCFIDVNDPKIQYPVDFFDVESWKKYAFSPCISRALPSLTTPQRRNIFANLPSLINSTEKQQTPPLPLPPDPDTKTELKHHALTHRTSTSLDISLNPPSSPLSADTISTLPLPLATSYLERTLRETLSFRKSLHHNHQHQINNAYPPLAVLYSTSLPTIYGAKVAGRDGIARADAYDNLAFGSGDGVVLARAAMLPKGYVCSHGGRVRTERAHVGMLGDLDAVGRCLSAVMKARNAGVGMGVGYL